MSAPIGCCTPCQSVEVTNVPGTEGAAGAAGAAGTNGKNSFSVLTANVIIPAVGANVSINVADNTWAGVLQTIFLSDGTDVGTFTVASKTGSTVITGTFLGAPGDGSPGAVIGSGGSVSPGGHPQTTPLTVATGGTGDATLTDRAVLIGRGTNPVEFAAPGAAGQVLRSTGPAANPAFGAVDLADTDAVTGLLAIANGGTNAATKAAAQTSLGVGQTQVSEFSSGTAYQLTNGAAVVTFGTSGAVEVAPNAAGLWHLYYFVRFDYNGATFAANQTVQAKLRRSNNTAADVTNSTREWKTEIITTLSHTAALLSVGPIPYSTVNVNDNIQLLSFVGTLPGAGTLDAVEAYLIAVPIALA